MVSKIHLEFQQFFEEKRPVFSRRKSRTSSRVETKLVKTLSGNSAEPENLQDSPIRKKKHFLEIRKISCQRSIIVTPKAPATADSRSYSHIISRAGSLIPKRTTSISPTKKNFRKNHSFKRKFDSEYEETPENEGKNYYNQRVL